MLEFLQRYIRKKYGYTKKAYNLILIFDLIQNGLMLLIVGKLFNSIIFVIIGSLIIFRLSDFAYHFHCKNLNHCTIITTILFSIFSIISKQSIDYLWIVFLACLYCVRDLYLKMPLKIVNKNKSEEWHKKGFVNTLCLLLIMSLFFYYFGKYEICSYILYGIILYDLLFFINTNNFI